MVLIGTPTLEVTLSDNPFDLLLLAAVMTTDGRIGPLVHFFFKKNAPSIDEMTPIMITNTVIANPSID